MYPTEKVFTEGPRKYDLSMISVYCACARRACRMVGENANYFSEIRYKHRD